MLDNWKYGALNSASTRIRWGHLTCGMSNPMENDFVKVVLEGPKRMVGKPLSQQKEPMTVDMVKQVAGVTTSNPKDRSSFVYWVFRVS